MAKQWFRVFKAGTYPQGKFDTAYIDKAVAAYDPKDNHHAPLVVGEHSTKGPAFGWVSEIRRSGDYLEAAFEDVATGLKDNKSFRKPSVSFYPDKPYLRHVALLGATPPQVKGLDVQFGDEGGDPIVFEEPTVAEADVLVKAVVATKVKPEPETTPTPTPTPKPEDEPVFKEQLDALRAEFAEKLNVVVAENQKLASDLTEVQKAHRDTRRKDFTDRMLSEGILTPADLKRPGFAEFSDMLLDKSIEFSEGDDADATKVNARSWFESFIGKLRPQVPLKPVIIHRGPAPLGGSKVKSDIGGKEFSLVVPEGSDPEDVKFLEKVKALATEESISFEEACRRVDKEHGISRHR